MADRMIVQRLKGAIQTRSQQPPGKRQKDLINRGVINKAGQVILRAPGTPAGASVHSKHPKGGGEGSSFGGSPIPPKS